MTQPNPRKSSQRPVRRRTGLFIFQAGGIDAVLFDNDGVRADTESAFFKATREASAKKGVVPAAGYRAGACPWDGRNSREIAEDPGVRPDRIEILIEWTSLPKCDDAALAVDDISGVFPLVLASRAPKDTRKDPSG